jgi:glucokinase
MSKKNLIIGVDFGATFIKAGLVDSRGAIIKKSVFSSADYPKRESLIQRIVAEVKALASSAHSRVIGLGIGVPGPVDCKKGIIYNLVNVKGWKMAPLKSEIEKKISVPVFIDNDANAACAGEAMWGAGRGYSDIICVTLGSGVGTGVMIEKKIFRGRGYSAAEIGHVCLDIDGPACNCGANGCIETFIGNSYLVKSVVEKLKSGEKSSVLKLAGFDYSAITPKLINIAAKKGDKFCINVWETAGRYLGTALAGVVNIFNPEIIIIGGGLSKTGAMLFNPVRKTIKRRSMKVFTKGLKVCRARFVQDSGTVGAAALVLHELNIAEQ